MWQALEWVEQEAPAGTRIAWVGQPEPSLTDTNPADRRSREPSLGLEEGIHFRWHLHGRGRRDLCVGLLDAQGQPQPRAELGALPAAPTIVITAGSTPPAFLGKAEGSWQVQSFRVQYWGRWRRYECYVWMRSSGGEMLASSQ